jgi:L-asparaginase II
VEKLVEVTRGPLVESIHRGSIAVVDADGNLIAWAGDPEYTTYYRSSAKPIQALPVITSGAADKYKFSDEEIAIICASHSGEEEHVRVVTSILEKLELSPEFLLCGVHPPFYSPRAVEIWRQGEQPSTVHCNCSGKHSGMLALCKFNNWPLENYQELSHPLQKLLLNTMKEFHNLESIAVGVDGCGVPVYGMPLREMARGFARLADPTHVAEANIAAVKWVVSSMTKYPRLVAGTGRLDAILMEKLGHKLVTKCGAEGVQCIGLLDRGIGIAIKIEDGNIRATEPAAIEVLRQLGVVSEAELKDFAEQHHPPIKNHRKETVGTIMPTFKLTFK